VLLFTKLYNLVPCEGLHAKSAVLFGSGIGSNEQGGYCRAVLRWFSNCKERRYKSSALPFTFILETYSGIARFPCDSTAFLYAMDFSIRQAQTVITTGDAVSTEKFDTFAYHYLLDRPARVASIRQHHLTSTAIFLFQSTESRRQAVVRSRDVCCDPTDSLLSDEPLRVRSKSPTCSHRPAWHSHRYNYCCCRY